MHVINSSPSESTLTNSLTQHTIKPRLRSVVRKAIEDQHIPNDHEEDSRSSKADSQPKLASELFVQVSQHSSLDRDQYNCYQSSLSVRSYLSSAPLHEDSGLGESSPAPEASELCKYDQEGIVPDSQSLPGSSTYRPAASTAGDIGDHKQRRTRLSRSHCSPNSTIDSLEPSILLETLYSDPIEDSSGLYVAESPENRIWSETSASVPAQSIIESSVSNSNRDRLLAKFTRSISDPSSLIYIAQKSSSAVSESSESPPNRLRPSSRGEIGKLVYNFTVKEKVLDSQASNLVGSDSQVRVVDLSVTISVLSCGYQTTPT